MEWHINDLSLSGQFATPTEFRESLEPLLKLRLTEPRFRERLYCSRSLSTRPVTATATGQQAILTIRDKNFVSLALAWLGKSGPFWDDERQSNDDYYFAYQGVDVTDQGLGETARRQLEEIDAGTFSFMDSSYGFTNTPLLIVQHGLDDQVLGKIEVDNFWEISQISDVLDSITSISSWYEVQVEIQRRFDQLIISDDAMEKQNETPFKICVANRIFERLGVLNKLANESDETGKLSTLGNEIYTNYFTGDRARFSDESADNKASFKYEMSFKDPANPAQKIFCPWHGKIQTPQTRIHFEWPRPANQKKVKVLYIGPKITKH
jgi:hypothetical protein